MKKGIKWNCDNCGADVLLTPVKLSFIVNDEFIYYDDTDKYECSLCDNRVVYKTKESEIREKCFDAEFKRELRNRFSHLSDGAVTLLLMLLEYVNPKYYLCMRNDDKLLRIDHIRKITGHTEAEIDLLINELWKERVVMQIKVNDNKLYAVNGFSLGFEDSYDVFVRKGLFYTDFFRKTNKSKESSRKRQARINVLPNRFTDEQKAELLRKFNGKCAFTGKDVPIQIDHVIPVASGHGGTILENMLPIWQRINSSKGDRNVFEWYEKNGERFEVVPELFEQAIGYVAELNDMTYEEYREYVYDCHNAKLTQTN